jgi:hypothetical protein
MKQQMTAQELIRNMFSMVSTSLTESEYQLLQIPSYRIFKRRDFSGIYKTLLLYLIRLSISGVFQNRNNDLIKMFDEWYRLAYKNNNRIKKEIDNDLKKFKELTDFNNKKPFENLSRYIVELFEQKPKKLLFITLLEKRIEELYSSFIKTGEQIEVIKNFEEVNVINRSKEAM